MKESITKGMKWSISYLKSLQETETLVIVPNPFGGGCIGYIEEVRGDGVVIKLLVGSNEPTFISFSSMGNLIYSCDVVTCHEKADV